MAVLLLVLSACSKELSVIRQGDIPDEEFYGPNYNDLAIGTIRSRDGVRYVRLNVWVVCMIVNPDEVKDIVDGTRVFLQYRGVAPPPTMPDFCMRAILVEWATPLDVGEVSHSANDRQGDPISVVMDWMTNVEDGFFTLHYSVPSKGKASHRFTLCPGENENEYRLIHDANGDTEGDMTDGIVCFYIESLLPETGGEAVKLSLTYLNIDHTSKTLTVDYRSPQ